MTFFITLNFIARSSLGCWIPLALLKMIEDPRFIVPIILAGLSITIPTCIFSIAIDSYYYGVFTCPQFNFVYVNVIENISIYFGQEPWYYYIERFHEEFNELGLFGYFGLFLISYRQMTGQLTFYNESMRR